MQENSRFKTNFHRRSMKFTELISHNNCISLNHYHYLCLKFQTKASNFRNEFAFENWPSNIYPSNRKNTTYSNQSKMMKEIENCNPNVSNPRLQLPLSQSIVKPGNSSENSASRNTGHDSNSSSFRNKVQERKLKKSTNEKRNSSAAHESYCASKDDIFKNQQNVDCEIDVDNMVKQCKNGDKIYREEKVSYNVSADCVNDMEINAMRSMKKLFEEVPEPRSGRVMYLVRAFEKLSVLNLDNFEGKKVMKDYKKVSSSSLSPVEFCMTSKNLGSDSRHSFSIESSHGSFSLSTITPAGGQRSRHSSAELSETSSGRKWRKKQLKATSPRPFKLRTEQRGRYKEEEFTKKLHQMLEEEERLRVPIAQGLPWTIDEPECLVKPPVKENTRPVDLVLYTDTRAAERAEFDHQVAEKKILIEQHKIEMERQQKLEEEEETRRLRKALVPKAQPMPNFDKPFLPKRSSKKQTIPNEPKSSARPQHKERLNGESG